MFHRNPPPPPSAEALALIEKVFRLANALRLMGVNPGAARVAQIISAKEAFVLLDHIRGPWRMAIWAPAGRSEPIDVQEIAFDLDVVPKPGLIWGYLFGVSLIIEPEEEGRS